MNRLETRDGHNWTVTGWIAMSTVLVGPPAAEPNSLLPNKMLCAVELFVLLPHQLSPRIYSGVE